MIKRIGLGLAAAAACCVLMQPMESRSAEAQGATLGVSSPTAGEGRSVARTARRSFSQGERFSAADNETFELVFVDGTSVTLSPGSVVWVESYNYDGTTRIGELSVRVESGLARISGGTLNDSSAVRIGTPFGTAEMEGGVSLVEVTPEGVSIALAVGRSLSFVDSAGQRVDLKSGQQVGQTRDGKRQGPTSISAEALARADALLNPGLASGAAPIFLDEGDGSSILLASANDADDTAKDATNRNETTTSGGSQPPTTPPPTEEPTPPPTEQPPSTPPPEPFTVPDRVAACTGCAPLPSEGLERNTLGEITSVPTSGSSSAIDTRTAVVLPTRSTFASQSISSPDYAINDANGIRDTTDRFYRRPSNAGASFTFEEVISGTERPTRAFNSTQSPNPYIFFGQRQFDGLTQTNAFVGDGNIVIGSDNTTGGSGVSGLAQVGFATASRFGDFINPGLRQDGGCGFTIDPCFDDDNAPMASLQAGLHRWMLGCEDPNGCGSDGATAILQGYDPFFPNQRRIQVGSLPTYVDAQITGFCANQPSSCRATLEDYYRTTLVGYFPDPNTTGLTPPSSPVHDYFSVDDPSQFTAYSNMTPITILDSNGNALSVEIDTNLSAYGLNAIPSSRPADLIIAQDAVGNVGVLVRAGTQEAVDPSLPWAVDIDASTNASNVFGTDPVVFVYRANDFFLTAQGGSVSGAPNAIDFFFATGSVSGPADNTFTVDRFFVTPGLTGFPTDPSAPGATVLGDIRAFLRTETNPLTLPLQDTGLYVATRAAGGAPAAGHLFHADFGLEGLGSAQKSTISITLGSLQYETTRAQTETRLYGQSAQALGLTVGSTRESAATSSRAIASPLFSTAVGGGNPDPDIVDTGRVGYLVLENFDPVEIPDGGRERSVAARDNAPQSEYRAADYALLRLATAYSAPNVAALKRPSFTGASQLTGWISGLAEVEGASDSLATIEVIDTGARDASSGPLDFALQLDSDTDEVSASISHLRIGNEQPVALSLGGNSGASAYIDTSNYGAATTAVADQADIATQASAALVAGQAVLPGWQGADATASARLNSYEHLQWGFFFGDVCVSSPGCDPADPAQRVAHAHLTSWVAGAPWDVDLPSNVTATYRGHVLGNVYDGANYYSALGTIENTWSFASRASVGTGTVDFDGNIYDLQTRTRPSGPLVFEGRLDAKNGVPISGALHGSFVRGTVQATVPDAMIGQFSLSSNPGTGSYIAAGTFGAERNHP